MLNKSIDFIIPISHRLLSFLKEDMNLILDNEDIHLSKPIKIDLFSCSSLIKTLGEIKLNIYFSYEEEIMKSLVNAFLYGDEVSSEEYNEVRDSVCMEIANTIIGNVLVNPSGKSLLDITPPELIFQKKVICDIKKEEIKQTEIYTKFGKIKVLTVENK